MNLADEAQIEGIYAMMLAERAQKFMMGGKAVPEKSIKIATEVFNLAAPTPGSLAGTFAGAIYCEVVRAAAVARYMGREDIAAAILERFGDA